MNLWNQADLTKMNGLEELEEKDLEVVTGGFINGIFDAVFGRRDPIPSVNVTGDVSTPGVSIQAPVYVNPYPLINGVDSTLPPAPVINPYSMQ